MTYALIAIVVVVLAAVFIYTMKRNQAIQANGIEADAVVSRIEESETKNDNGDYDITYTYYVKYQAQDGSTVEAKLGNAPADIYRGCELRVKYLPEKPKFVIPAK